MQIMAGAALHNGKIVEMQTGEGKTLAAVMPAYLNALDGKGVHILTFNDYLAHRDAEWMGPIYEFLGLRKPEDRQLKQCLCREIFSDRFYTKKNVCCKI